MEPLIRMVNEGNEYRHKEKERVQPTYCQNSHNTTVGPRLHNNTRNHLAGPTQDK